VMLMRVVNMGLQMNVSLHVTGAITRRLRIVRPLNVLSLQWIAAR
jgi:hypothetical protein